MTGAVSVRPAPHPTPRARILRRFFSRLGSSELPYAVMRNVEGLPDELRGNDVDLMVLPEHLDAHRRLLRETAESAGWKVISAVEKINVRTYRIVSGPNALDGPGAMPEVLMFDYFPGDSWYGARFVEPAEVLERRVQHGPVDRLSAFDETYCLVLHHLLCTGNIGKDAYRPRIEAVMQGERERFEAAAAARFGPRRARELGDRLLAELAEGGTGEMPDLQRRLRRALVTRDLFRRPLRSAARWASLARFELRRLRRPMGAVVALWSEDGPEQAAATIRALTPWLWLIDRRSHAFVDHPQPELIATDHRYSRRRVHSDYGLTEGAVGAGDLARARGRARRNARLGWVVLVQDPDGSATVEPRPDLVLLQGRRGSSVLDARCSELSRAGVRFAVIGDGDAGFSDAGLSAAATAVADELGRRQRAEGWIE